MTAVPASPSGLPAVDRQWGGLTSGRAYLLVGRAGAGRSALALQTARAAIDAGERCLVISPRPPEALVEVGQSVGLDLAAAHSAGSLRLLRIPSAADLAARGSDGLAKSYRDLAALVTHDQPGRVVIEDFTPLVQFDTFERFHDAFSEFVIQLRDQGTTLLIGLGDPANDASRRLLDVVESLVDGTIRLGAGGDLVLGTPGRAAYPSSDGPSMEAVPPPHNEDSPAESSAPPDPSAPLALTPEPAPPASAVPSHPPAAQPAALEENVETTFAVSSDEAESASQGPDGSSESGAVEPSHEDAASAAASPEDSNQPEDLDQPEDSNPSESSYQMEATDSLFGGDPFGTDASSDPDSEAPAASGPGGLIETDIVAPPPADPSLMHSGTDPFGYDPTDSLFEQGFLADSGIRPPLPQTSAPYDAATSAQAPAPPPFAPPFAPLGAPAVPPPDAFRATLDRAFVARASGDPFQVVAVRMDPSTAAAGHFDAVMAGLQASLRSGDEVRVDAGRKRAAVVLPSSGPEAGQALFAGLQSHLRSALGGNAEAVLQGVAAVTVADGQPFQTPDDLVAYALEG